MRVDLPDWAPDLSGWWHALTSNPEQLVLLVVIGVVILLVARWLLRSWPGRILLLVAGVIVVLAATSQGSG